MLSKILSVLLIFTSSYSIAADSLELAAKELVKKYGTIFKGDLLVLKDDPSWKDRIVIKNDYGFEVSYPKCYKIDASDGTDEINEKTTASMNFIRTEKCKNIKIPINLDSFDITYLYGRRDVDLKSSLFLSGQTIYTQPIKVNGSDGLISGELQIGNIGGYSKPQEYIRYSVKVKCADPIDRYFMSIIQLKYGEESMEVLKSKKYGLPEDVLQILSSFKCTKTKKKASAL